LHIDAPRPSGTSPPTVPERCRASNHLEQIGQTDNPSRWRAGHAPVKHRDVWCVAEETAHRSLSIHEYSGRRGLRCFHQDSWDRVPTPRREDDWRTRHGPGPKKQRLSTIREPTCSPLLKRKFFSTIRARFCCDSSSHTEAFRRVPGLSLPDRAIHGSSKKQ
jgi:hypothetical protein